jgi:hypothetical protein
MIASAFSSCWAEAGAAVPRILSESEVGVVSGLGLTAGEILDLPGLDIRLT